MLSGIKRTRAIDITEEQLKQWEAGLDLIQNIAPNISADDREFILTGSTPEEWDEEFKEDEEDDKEFR
jgi:hypothetical protein